MTIEERLQQLEATDRTRGAMLNLLISIEERQQALLEEIQQDTRQTQRLWFHWRGNTAGWTNTT